MEHLKGAELAEMIEAATVDAYVESPQQVMGLYDRLEECLPAVFETTVLGVKVTVEGISYANGVISADCVRGEYRQSISLLELPHRLNSSGRNRCTADRDLPYAIGRERDSVLRVPRG